MNLSGVASRGRACLVENLHHLWIKLRHQDLNGLIRLKINSSGYKPVKRVKSVQVPAVTKMKKFKLLTFFQNCKNA